MKKLHILSTLGLLAIALSGCGGGGAGDDLGNGNDANIAAARAYANDAARQGEVNRPAMVHENTDTDPFVPLSGYRSNAAMSGDFDFRQDSDGNAAIPNGVEVQVVLVFFEGDVRGNPNATPVMEIPLPSRKNFDQLKRVCTAEVK